MWRLRDIHDVVSERPPSSLPVSSRLWSRATAAAERGWVPDALLRVAIRRLCRGRLREEDADDAALAAHRTAAFAEAMGDAPVAVAADRANAQHYEVPAAFFRLVLGPWMKYSCALFEPPAISLADAEERMLALTSERAGLGDGMRVLDLGCGWGSFALFVAERFPRARVTAVSNSKSQREHIVAECRRRGLAGVEVVTADVSHFEAPAGAYDRIVSVEMFEHVRSWPRLLGRAASWLAPEGRLFLHVFCHRSRAYAFEDRGAGDWMARHFFTGGIMPSEDLIHRVSGPLSVEAQWRVDGLHYRHTAEAWLARLDAARPRALEALREAYGADAERVLGRWRLFFLAVAELFGTREGSEWFVTQARLAPHRES